MLLLFLFMVLILALIIIKRHGVSLLLPKNYVAQMLRGACVTVGVGLYYWAINFIHIADATAMVFVAPLIVTALSPIFLNEPLGLRRTVAVIVGFIGVLVILRPDLEGDRIGYFIALASGVFLGFFYMANRKLADGTPHVASSYYTALTGAVILIPFAPFFWTQPQMVDAVPMFAFVSLATVGQVLMVSSFAYAAANIIAPFVYSQIIAATAVGIIMFDAFPDNVTWLGIAIVVTSGIYIAVRESRLSG